MNRLITSKKIASPSLALSVILLASLAACGGGSNAGADALAQSSESAAVADAASQPAAGEETLDADVASALAQTEVQPAYHMAPALLDEPDQADVGGTNASARVTAKHFDVDADVAGLPTARLSREALTQRIAQASKARVQSAASDTSAPMATTIKGTVYTPAQIRAAYGLAPLPAAGASLSTAQAAQLGAGQTIYIVDAYHDASAMSDLNAFSSKFGLPACTQVAVATTATTLPAAPSHCTFSQVYLSATSVAMTGTAPAYNAVWAPESKLDVQWAHAIAPLARIVLIEMPNSMSTSILYANKLATKLGPGAVSMSFGSAEAGWAKTVDSYFAGSGMTFVAAAGDSGAQVLWPAVSPNVLAVGGTSTNVSSNGSRIEVAWSGSGGGMSAYSALPSWQSGVTPAGGGALVRRAVPDVAFNANPMTGEYVAVTLPNKATVWSAYGGTSIAAPQWAAMVAVANAIRAANAKSALGDIHSLLYKSIAPVPGLYASALGDVVEGTNGSCGTCRAGNGFDQATGWGTPNASGLFAALTGVAAPQAVTGAAPTVPGGSFTTKVGAAFSKSLGITAPSGTSYSVSGAPAGLGISNGTVNWAAPVAGSHSFTVTAMAAGKSASATYSIKVIAGTAPVFTSAASRSGTAGSAFSSTLSATNPNAGTLSYSLSGAPSGLTVSSSGALSWASPVAGTYTFNATVTDSYGYSTTQSDTVKIAAAPAAPTKPAPPANGNHAPTLASATVSAKARTTFSTMLVGKDADGGSLTYTASGVPAGATLSASGFFYGAVATKGTYSITVTVHDSKGATGSATIKLVVA